MGPSSEPGSGASVLISLEEVAPLWLLLLPLLGQTFANILPAGTLIPAGQPGSLFSTWEEFGASGESFFETPAPGTAAPGAARTWGPGTPGYVSGMGYPGSVGFLLLPEAGAALAGTLGDPLGALGAVTGAVTGPEPVIGPGGAERAAIAEQLRLEEAAKLAAGAAEVGLDATLATLDYISDIPAEIGEAGGEFLEELGTGAGAGAGALLGGVLDPLTAAPGDLLGGIPIWAPALVIAWLALGSK